MKEQTKEKTGELLTLREAAGILGLSRRTLYRYIQDRIFQRWIKYPGGDVRLYLEDVLAFRKKCEVMP